MLFKTLVSTHGTLTVPAIAAVSFFPILQVVKAHLGNMLMAKGLIRDLGLLALGTLIKNVCVPTRSLEFPFVSYRKGLLRSEISSSFLTRHV